PPLPLWERGQGGEGVHFRNFWGRTKRAQLQDALDNPAAYPYQPLDPPLAIGLPFLLGQVEADYFDWPLLTDLLPTSFPGVQSKRDDVVVDINKEQLVARMRIYFDAAVSDSEIVQLIPRAMERTNQAFDPVRTRKHLVARGFLPEYISRYCFHPFDMRWIYWEPETDLLGRKSPDFWPNVFDGNTFLEARRRESLDQFARGYVSSVLSDNFGNGFSNFFPLYLRASSQPKSLFDLEIDPRDLGDGRRLNLSDAAVAYLSSLGGMSDAEALFYHSIAVLHAPAYRAENAGALRQDWPRVPLPASRALLLASAELGRQVAALLDNERPVVGVTSGAIRDELRTIGVLSVVGGEQLNPAAGDLDLTAGWGFAGRGGITMPGKGRVSARATKPEEEHPALGLGAGASTYDIALNERAYWRNLPPRVWEYTIGGYQVIKKWLSYRERPLLGRGLSPDEARAVTQIARRIAAILLLEAELDAHYRRVAADTDEGR
ncbi:MAG: DNA methyltransferase, partial [Oscillochloris sp.]|nr:DNA methyltransferase [Oscillochloris sp.]